MFILVSLRRNCYFSAVWLRGPPRLLAARVVRRIIKKNTERLEEEEEEEDDLRGTQGGNIYSSLTPVTSKQPQTGLDEAAVGCNNMIDWQNNALNMK